jgi:hypothetical protein
MAANEAVVRELVALGISYRAALKIADPASDLIDGGAVSDPAAVTAPAQMGATYTQANVNALQADVTALRATVATLVTALKSAGVIT